MSKTVRYHGHFDDAGNLNASSFRAALKELAARRVPVVLTVEEWKGDKTNPQNRFLHQLFQVIATEVNKNGWGDGTQWTKETVKAYAKQNELYPVVELPLPQGRVGRFAVDTRDLTKEQAMETITRVIEHFEDMGLVLERPGQQTSLAA